MGGQISWLIPGALIGLVAALWLTRRAPRTDRVRAGFLIFGGWLLLTGAVLSFAHGIIHPYYTVALAPAIGALVGMGASTLWARRQRALPPAGPGRGHRGHHRLGLRHPRVEPDLVPGPALGDPRRRYRRRPRHRPHPPGPGRAAGRAGRLRHRLGDRRTGRLLPHHGGHPAQRGHSLRRPSRPERRRVRRARRVRRPGGFGGLGGFGGIARNGITLPTGLHPAQRGQASPRAEGPRELLPALPGGGSGGGAAAGLRGAVRRRVGSVAAPVRRRIRRRRWSRRR